MQISPCLNMLNSTDTLLEDDFIFNKDVAKHAIHVDDFLKRDTLFVYQLGSKPFVAIPIHMYHYRNHGVLTHANMYSSLARSHLLDDYKEGKMKDNLDTYISNTVPIHHYVINYFQ